jgi:hypothetical protein
MQRKQGCFYFKSEGMVGDLQLTLGSAEATVTIERKRGGGLASVVVACAVKIRSNGANPMQSH